jgi:predicted nuclease with TOPRIM domain
MKKVVEKKIAIKKEKLYSVLISEKSLNKKIENKVTKYLDDFIKAADERIEKSKEETRKIAITSYTVVAEGMRDDFKIVNDQISEMRDGIKDLNTRFDGLENRFDGLENRFDRLEGKVDSHDEQLKFIKNYLIENLEPRIVKIETKQLV